MTEQTLLVSAKDIENDHLSALMGMNDAHRLAMSREILAALALQAAQRAGETYTRKQALDAIFEAEAAAVSSGASPQTDFYLPLTNDLPIRVDR